jgi:type IV pilus assembly protein PilZ
MTSPEKIGKYLKIVRVLEIRGGRKMAKRKPERRANDRVPLRIQIQYQTADQFFQDYIQNLSIGGIFIETSSPLKVGTRLKVQFCLPEIQKEILADGMVVRKVDVRSKDPRLPGMGIQFSDLNSRDKRILDEYIRRIGMD